MKEIGKIKIEDCVSISNGYAFKSADYIDSGIRVIRITNVQKGEIVDNNPQFYPIETKRELSNYLIEEGDILMSLTGNVGRVGIFPKELLPAYLNQRVARLSVKNEKVHSKYLYYYLNSNLFEREAIENSAGIAQLNLSTKWVASQEIPLPPLETQKKIAAILDAADKHRTSTAALIDKYTDLAQSLFLEMFGDPVTNPKEWEKKKLGAICGVGSSKRVFVDELVEEGVPFYRGTEVGKLGEGKSIDPTLFITKEHYKNLKEHRGIPKKGDLLMPSICPDGRIWVVDSDKEFYFKDGRVLWVEVDPVKINSIYLRYHLKGSFFANYGNIASGTTFAELKIVALKKMSIFYPKMKLQNQFAQRVQAIEIQKKQVEDALVKAEELFQRLLQDAFKGVLGTDGQEPAHSN